MNTKYQFFPMVALALLVFTSCSEQKTNSTPEPSDSNPHTSTATASNSANPNATPQATEHYSGGSKAPNGEYRPADEFGPAQNVPKPVAPEGMNIETIEGLEKFIKYWQDSRNYANQTGDTSAVSTIVSDSFENEKNFYSALNNIYGSDGWVIGGNINIIYDKDSILANGNGEYSIGCNIDTEDSVLWYGGEARVYDNSKSRYEGVELKLIFQDGHWLLLGTGVTN